MYEHFADWYSLVAPQFDSKRLEDRWNAAVAYADSLNVPDASGAARVLLNRTNVQPQHDAIRQLAKKIDSTYISTDDALEIRVICAGATAHLLTKRSHAANAIALSVLCGIFQRNDLESFVSEVAGICKRALITEAARVRDSDLVFPVFSPKTINESLKAQAPPPDLPSVQSNLAGAITAVTNSLSNYLGTANEAISQIRTVQQEESDILWWLMGAHSLKTNLPFSKTKQSELALIAAYDLASITRLTPGPAAAEAFLDHVLRFAASKKEKTSLQDAVNTMNAQVKGELGQSADHCHVPWDLIPCYAAIPKSIEVGGGKGWETAFSTLTGLDAATPVKSTALAYQAYMERILVRIVTSQAG